VKQKKTVFMAEIAILAALILIMAFTPIGYLRIGALSLTLLMIPVSVGAVVMGPLAGAGLGCLFGLTSFAQCFMGDVLGSILAAKNIFFTFVVCVVSRTLAGLLCGVVYRLFRKKSGTVPLLVSNLLGSLLNTALFLGLLALLFWNFSFNPEQAQALGGVDSALQTVILLATGINAPIELLVCGIAGTAVSKAVIKLNSIRV